MADSKYAGLPGIAYDQVDVYETTDLPEAEQYQLYSEVKNDDEGDTIEKIHISASEAFNKFKGKHVAGKGVDFSDRISRKPRIGYRFGDWELPGDGEKETPIQKCQRLQYEVQELLDEINELKEKAKDEAEITSTTDLISQVEFIGKQLNSMKLEECLGPELVATLSDPQGTRLKQLISQIELFKQAHLSSESKAETKTDKTDDATEPHVLKYQMMYLPEKARMQELARVAQLEQRLCTLENTIGTTNEKYTKFSQSFKCQGVIDAVQQLGAKASILDTNQLDTIETRLAALLHKMDNIAQKKSAVSQDSEQEQKIAEMYDILKKTETISEILPQTVNRMLALSSVHQQAAEFNKSLMRLEELHDQISTGIESNKTLLQGVQQNFASNLDVIMKNITSLDERISKLNK